MKNWTIPQTPMSPSLNRIDTNLRLVIVLTEAAPSFFVKCLFFSPFFWLFNGFGYLNQSGKFHIKISTFHYTRCFHQQAYLLRLQWNHSRTVIKTNPIGWTWSSISDPSLCPAIDVTFYNNTETHFQSKTWTRKNKIAIIPTISWACAKKCSVNSFLTAEFDKRGKNKQCFS